MRVVCDNCGASYKIPDSKLTREVNKATCRKCGHAIYIRRSGADGLNEAPLSPADERTAIKSVADLDRPTAVQHDASGGESTIPRDEPMMAEPAPMLRGSGVTILPVDARGSNGASNGHVPFGQADRDRPTIASQPERAPSRPPGRSMPPPMSVPEAQPAPQPAPALAPAPISPQQARNSLPPLASPSRPAALSTPSAFDPSSDLSVALLSSMVAILGVAVLVASNLVVSTWAGAVGAFLALFGILVVVLVLLTGGRGARKASLFMAAIGAFVIALFGAAATAAGGWALNGSIPAPPAPPIAAAAPEAPPKPDAAAATMADVAPAPPAADPTTPPVADAAAPAPAVADAVAPTPPAPPAPAPVVAPAPAPAPTPVSRTNASPERIPASSSSSSSSSSDAARAAAAAKAAADARAAADAKAAADARAKAKADAAARAAASTASSSSAPTASSSASAISLQVVDVMLRSNKGVKTCFINEMHDNGGSVPKGVKVKLTIDPSGKVSKASTQGDYNGTPFDSCLGSAIKAITFPPYEGDPVSLTYPFQT